jgi:putative acetyltransferase
MIAIRTEQPGDAAAIRALNQAVFGRRNEAEVVDAVRAACPNALSLVAEDDGRLVGHVLFSPVTVSNGEPIAEGMGLGPIAVVPDRQRQGIGSLLVRAGIEALREWNYPFIIVVGHPGYYPQFGFVPASRHGLCCPWEDVPDEAFMVLLLDEAAMEGVSGTVAYQEAFNQAT